MQFEFGDKKVDQNTRATSYSRSCPVTHKNQEVDAKEKRDIGFTFWIHTLPANIYPAGLKLHLIKLRD